MRIANVDLGEAPLQGLILVPLLASGMARAQGPLTIEQLLVDPARWQLTSAYELRAAAPAEGVSQRRTGWSTALRYGVSSRLEVSARISGEELLVERETGDARRNTEHFSVGFNWLAQREGVWPALVFELNANFAEDPENGDLAYNGAHWAITTYRSIDPLVLSLTVSGHQLRDYRRNGLRVQPGDAYAAETRVSFAVNPQVTLFAGIDLRSLSPSRIDGRELPGARSATGVSGGFAYAPSPRHTFFFDADVAPADRAGGLSVRWYFQF